jgi:chromosome segregation ATPase
MNTYEIQKDLQKALEKIDKNDYVLKSAINHLQEECSEEEVKLVEEQIYELEPKDYDTREEFIEDYQPIFDLVDFPLKECFRLLEKRTFNWDAL